ncbi:MAG: glycosyltransferase family 4 protein [Candidatus Omnitrophota bacterium]
MRRTKLLYIITKLELGGAQKQLLSLISNLDRERFDIFLITAKTGLLLDEASKLSRLKIKKSRFLERPINPLKDILALFEIYRFIKKQNIEIVHTHSSKAGILGRLAAWLAKTRYIIHTVHGWPFNDFQAGFLRNLYIGLERFVAGFTDRLIVVSCHDKEKGLVNNIGKADKYSLIHYGIDFDKFNKKEQNIKKELGIGLNDFVVTNISCFKPQKSCLDFVKLAHLVNRNLSHVKFLLVGDGDLRRNIESLIIKLKLQDQIILTGCRKDIPEILSITDVLSLTSLWEGVPIAVLEAMAAGCPVLATNTGGIAEIVAEGITGFLSVPGDMEDMSEKLILLLKDIRLRAEMSKNSRAYLGEHFRLRNMIDVSQDIYMEA